MPTSRNGPSGVGVVRFSHAPCRAPAPTLAANARTSEVLPTPASPPTKTSRPPAARAGLELAQQLVALEDERRHGALAYRVCGKPRSTLLVAGSGQRLVTTLPRV